MEQLKGFDCPHMPGKALIPMDLPPKWREMKVCTMEKLNIDRWFKFILQLKNKQPSFSVEF